MSVRSSGLRGVTPLRPGSNAVDGRTCIALIAPASLTTSSGFLKLPVSALRIPAKKAVCNSGVIIKYSPPSSLLPPLV